MSLGKRLFTEGAAACLTETTDIFGDSSGKALYSLDFDASDTSGVYDGTPSNVDFGVGGYINTGARFNGSSSIITATQPSGINGPCSYSIWLKTTSSSYQSIITVGSVTGSHTAGVNLFVNSGKLSCQTGNGSNTENSTLNSTSNVDTGNWVHCVVTVAGSTQGSAIKIYVNKTNEISGTANNTAIVTATGEKLCLGGRILSGSQSTFLNGSLDQARIFTKELNQQEINTLFDEQACVHTATTTDNNYPVANTMYHKLDNSAVDEIGTATSTEQQMQYRFGKYGQAGLFNGLNNGSEINTNYTTGDTSLTHSIWINQSGISAGGFNVVLGRYWDGTTPLHLGYYMWTDTTTINWRVFFGGDGGTTSQFVQASGTITQNKWHHIVATWTDGTGAKLYIDGSLAQSVSSSETRNKNGIALALGAFGHNRSNQANFKGLLDTHRYFNSELSSTQVTQLFEEKAEIDTSNFKTILYDGTNATQYISNLGMDLETSGGLVWVKNRTGTNSHALVDSVRGRGEYLYSDTTTVQSGTSSATSDLISFEKNGFFVGSVSQAGSVNTSGGDIVAWVWKAGGAAVTNNVGDIASQVSLNSTLGFSIVSYTGDANQSNTIGHGLKIGTTETRPDLIIVRNRTATNNPSWMVWSSVFTSSSQGLSLNSTSDANSITDRFGTITTTTFKGGTNGNNEVNGANTMIAYCFASVSGLSKIGSYAGNGSSTGPIIYTTDNGASDGSNGFEPSWLMIKRIDSAGEWNILDNRRDTSNPRDVTLWAQSNVTESTASQSGVYDVDFLTNGFQIKNLFNPFNNSSGTYLYVAFK